jgi:hypothetical protein
VGADVGLSTAAATDKKKDKLKDKRIEAKKTPFFNFKSITYKNDPPPITTTKRLLAAQNGPKPATRPL